MVVRAVRTLTSPPFLQRAGGSPESGKPQGGPEREGAAIPTRLQLAAVSALRALVSGDGPGYVVRATAAAMAAGGKGEAAAGAVSAVEELGDKEADAGTLLCSLWRCLLPSLDVWLLNIATLNGGGRVCWPFVCHAMPRNASVLAPVSVFVVGFSFSR